MVHIFVGRRSVGKTTLADYHCRKAKQRIRFSPRVTLPEHKDELLLVRAPSAQELSEAFAKDRTVTIVPEHDVDECFMATAYAVRRWYSIRERSGPHTQRTGFIVDEARFDAVRDSRDLDWLFRNATQDMMHVYLTVHRPKDMNPDIRAIADHWYVFRVTQQRDIDVLEDETHPIIATRAPSLKKREFYKMDMTNPDAQIEHWYDVRKNCANNEHHHCSHVWSPIAKPTTIRMVNPVINENEEEDELPFEEM